jgi:predicted RNase H-like nuclease (RuvC/YqgF family)
VVYKTASELLQEQESAQTQVIYDMTGPQSRVITSTSQLKQATSQSEALFDMPELTHNIRELISLQESEIRNNDRKLKHQQKQESILQRECDEHEKSIERDQEKLDTLSGTLLWVGAEPTVSSFCVCCICIIIYCGLSTFASISAHM